MPRVSHLVKGKFKCRSHEEPSSSVAWLNGLLAYWKNIRIKRKPITDHENGYKDTSIRPYLDGRR